MNGCITLLGRRFCGLSVLGPTSHTVVLADATYISRPARIVLAGRVSGDSSFRLDRRHLGVRGLAGMTIEAVRSLLRRTPCPCATSVDMA